MYCFNWPLSNAGKLLFLTALLFVCTQLAALAQSGQISGVVYDIHQKPLQGVSILLSGLEKKALSNEKGAFSLQPIASGTYQVSFSLIGYEKKSLAVKIAPNQKKHFSVVLLENILHLQEIEVTSPALQKTGTNKIDKLDLRLRPVSAAQDLLKNVPGLFIGQHAGGGKAEQLFLRGFDIDHGTDYALFVDEMPVNMVSQAHGQGYAGGLTYKGNNLNGSLRYRYMGKRAANNDNSMQTAPYPLADAQLNYTGPKYELGLSFLNLLNREWQEVMYWSGSRLSHEAASVDDFHFTPGTPLFIKAAIIFFLKR